MTDIYTFKVALDKDLYRTIQVEGGISLDLLANAITNAFEFDFEHCFGFYSNLSGDLMASDEAYELFVDQDGEGIAENARGVKDISVSAVFAKDKVMSFLYDYGDEWVFHITCLDIAEAAANKTYPCVTEAKGVVEQYHDHHACGGCGHHH